MGRERETAQLTAALQAAAAGTGGVCLVSGEAGIGKTRLVADALDRHPAVPSGWGPCLEDETSPPLWPWRAALAQLGIDLAGQGAGGRFELALWLADALRARGGSAIVIDDAQWADPSSTRLLEVLAPMLHALPVLLVLTYRPGDVAASGHLRQLLPALERVRGARTIALRGLDPEATAELLTHVTPAQLNAELLSRIQARTEGNPFFIIQVGRLLPDAPEAQPIPVAARDAVRRRLNRLSPDCNTLLRAAAVIGGDVAVPPLAEVAELPEQAAAALLDEAAAAGILVRSGPQSVGFAHGLVRETLIAELSTPARASLHLRLAQLLERTRPDAVEALAFHYGEAIILGGSPKAFHYHLESARKAAADHDYAAQARFLIPAIDLADREPELGDAAALMLDRARALYRSGDLRLAWRAAAAAAARARLAGRSELMALAAVTVRGVGDPDLNREVVALCDECLDQASASCVSPALRVGVAAQALMARLHLDEAVPAERAVALLSDAERLHDPEALALALQLRHMTLQHPAEVRQRLALARRATEIAQQSGDRNLEAWAAGWEVDACFQLASRPELDRAIERLVRLGIETGELLVRWHGLMAQASLAVLEGRFTQALRLSADAAQMATAGGHVQGVFVDAVLRSQVGILTGDAALILAATPPEGVEPRPEVRGYLAMMHAAVGRRDEASADLRIALGSLDGVVENSLYQQWLCCLVFAAWMLQERDGIDGVLDRLRPYTGQLATVSRGQGGTLGVVDLFLGMASALAGNHAEAVDFLEQAVALSDRIGARPSAAWSRQELATVLTERYTAAGASRVEGLLRRAAREALALGMQPLLRAVQTLSAQLESRRPALSRREQEVAALVAGGFSNKEIGARLFLSERTVENHVRAVLDKLGFNSRTQVAAWVSATHAGQSRKN